MVARHDLTTDPRLRAELLTVRRGTAFFARKLGELSDAELDEPSLLPGWSRRHLIAHVGYNARALTRLVQWANTGVETPMYDSPEARDAEIDFGATLPARALRHLIEHAAISLDVEWRDSPDDAWAAVVRTAQGREVPARETVWMRTREVWLHAIDLDNGAGFGDVPEPVLERLLADITGTWRTRGTDAGILVTVDGAGDSAVGDDSAGGVSFGSTFVGDSLGGATDGDAVTVVSGTLPELVRWASGRGDAGVRTSTGAAVPAPRWL